MRVGLAVVLALAAISGTSQPPAAPVRLVIDTYYGERGADPYQYLEKLNDPEVLAWMRVQDAYTRQVSQQIPGRPQLLERFRQLDNSAGARVSMFTACPGAFCSTRSVPGAKRQPRLTCGEVWMAQRDYWSTRRR